MARVRIEIYPDDEDFNNVQFAEAQYTDVREAFDRAVAMARVALPPEDPKLKPGSYTFEMKNVQFTDATREVLFGAVAGGVGSAAGFDVRVESDSPPRTPCEAPCPDEDCRDRCARPVGHDDQHTTADGGCTWDRRTFKGDSEPCNEMCGFTACWANCQRPKDHRGEHRCDRPKDHERCLNEIGAPSATRNCQKPLNHGGHCDGEQEAGDYVAGMRD